MSGEIVDRRNSTLDAAECTYYRIEAFGAKRVECKWLRVRVQSYAQYPRALRVEYLPKGKRKALGFMETLHPSLLVLRGYGHPEPGNAFTPERVEAHPGGFVRTSMTRHSCYAPEWRIEFNATMAPYLEEHPGHVLADYRGHDSHRG